MLRNEVHARHRRVEKNIHMTHTFMSYEKEKERTREGGGEGEGKKNT